MARLLQCPKADCYNVLRLKVLTIGQWGQVLHSLVSNQVLVLVSFGSSVLASQ